MNREEELRKEIEESKTEQESILEKIKNNHHFDSIDESIDFMERNLGNYFSVCYLIEQNKQDYLQAELKGYQQAKKDFEKMIDDRILKIRQQINESSDLYQSFCHIRIVELEGLKSSLRQEGEKK